MGDSRFPSWPLSFGDPPAINALELIVLDATRLDVHPEPTSALALINRSLRQRSSASNVHILPAARSGLDLRLHPESSAPLSMAFRYRPARISSTRPGLLTPSFHLRPGPAASMTTSSEPQNNIPLPLCPLNTP